MDFTKHNKAINDILGSIESYQNNFIKTNPKYFDSLPSISQIPVTDTIADQLNTKPEGKMTKWIDTGLINKALPFSMQCLEYVTPNNETGWQIVFFTSDGTNQYWRSIGYGPEAISRTRDWTIIEPR